MLALAVNPVRVRLITAQPQLDAEVDRSSSAIDNEVEFA